MDTTDPQPTPSPALHPAATGAEPARRLDSFPPAQVVTLDDGTAVVLGSHPTGQVQVYRSDYVRLYRPETRATAVTDPAVRMPLLCAALIELHRRHLDDRRALEKLGDHHIAQRDEIRDYAIARHREGMYCRDGLNEFLARFGMPEYQPRITVHFSMTGSYEVDIDAEAGTAEDTASADAQNLTPDISNIGGLVDGTVAFEVTVEGTEVSDK